MRAMDGEPPEIEWLLDHDKERDSAEYRARYAELEDALARQPYVRIDGNYRPYLSLSGSSVLYARDELNAYRKIREARAAKEREDAAAREAEEREADRQCEEQRRAMAAMVTGPAPAPALRAGKASLADHVEAIATIQENGLRSNANVYEIVKGNLPGWSQKLFDDAWIQTPNRLKLERGEKEATPPRRPPKKQV
jgi:hypothetical protein